MDKPRTKTWVLLAILATGCATDGPAYGPPPRDVAAVVSLTSMLRFSPDETRIRVGDTVEWRNGSLFGHTVTFDPSQAADPGDAALPPGVKAFSSGRIPPGQVYRHTFDVAGVYRYFCSPHEELGMDAVVIVQP